MLMCLMQETTLQNTMYYYSHIILTANRTNYDTLCLLATKLIQACLKIQHQKKTKKRSLNCIESD